MDWTWTAILRLERLRRLKDLKVPQILIDKEKQLVREAVEKVLV